MTIHSTFSLPLNQFGGIIPELSSDVLNTLSSKLRHLKLIIIDEVSMVGLQMISHINTRLKQILKTTAPFGGISVLVFGDFNQLKPVDDNWIFKGPLLNGQYFLTNSLNDGVFQQFQ